MARGSLFFGTRRSVISIVDMSDLGGVPRAILGRIREAQILFMVFEGKHRRSTMNTLILQ